MPQGLKPVVAQSSETEQPERKPWKPAHPLLVTTTQAAEMLNVSERTVRNLIHDRKLLPKFIGRRCLIPYSAVEKFAKKVAGQ